MGDMALPSTHRRALLRGFCIVVSVGAGTGVTTLVRSVRGPQPLAVGGVAAALLLALAFLKSDIAWRVYRAWNFRLVHQFARIARHVVMRLCYFIIFVSVGRAGSRLLVATTDRDVSRWLERSAADLDTSRLVTLRHGRSRWLESERRYVRWACESGNVWAIALLPFLAILKICSAPPRADLPVFNIYTLF